MKRLRRLFLIGGMLALGAWAAGPNALTAWTVGPNALTALSFEETYCAGAGWSGTTWIAGGYRTVFDIGYGHYIHVYFNLYEQLSSSIPGQHDCSRRYEVHSEVRDVTDGQNIPYNVAPLQAQYANCDDNYVTTYSIEVTAIATLTPENGGPWIDAHPAGHNYCPADIYVGGSNFLSRHISDPCGALNTSYWVSSSTDNTPVCNATLF